jgi:hypothetical protein
MAKFRRVLTSGFASATLAVALTYVLGAPALLQTAQAEEGHNLFMSLLGAITGDHSSMARMHGDSASDESTTEGMSSSEMQAMNRGVLANNMLGSPPGMAAAGFAAVVIMSAIPLAAAAFVISLKQMSFVVAGLLAASGVTLMILPLANMNLAIPGPIIGVVAGLGILGLGVAKAVETLRALKAGSS